jgi:hypothetical protein
MSRDSKYVKQICNICADLCEECAKECEHMQIWTIVKDVHRYVEDVLRNVAKCKRLN